MTRVCAVASLIPERGVAALVDGGAGVENQLGRTLRKSSQRPEQITSPLALRQRADEAPVVQCRRAEVVDEATGPPAEWVALVPEQPIASIAATTRTSAVSRMSTSVASASTGGLRHSTSGVGMGANAIASTSTSVSAATPGFSGPTNFTAGKNPASPQVRIIEHADIKRMLLAQKSYSEGALALALYCARLVDEQHTGAPEAADDARLLLEVLTPIAKSFPSEWCLEANSLAIQIHGGYGYTRDFPVEQYWRDNRLNMIHEGTHGIQAADLLGRKVTMEGGRGLMLLAGRIDATIARAMQRPGLAAHANALASALQKVGAATKAAWATGDAGDALANAVPYMQAFGHLVLAWTWLDLLLVEAPAGAAATGRERAAQYFFHYELPRIDAWLAPAARRIVLASAAAALTAWAPSWPMAPQR